ncbi:MAG: hypothetical protein MJZ38_00300 [archaeon]|nr:hypothetical protein [archaeon]
MRTRSVLIVLILFVAAMMIVSVESYVYFDSVLVVLGHVVVWMMILSIVFGIVLYSYVKITSRSIIDPLDHVLDEEQEKE